MVIKTSDVVQSLGGKRRGRTRIYYRKNRLHQIILMLLDKHDVRCYFCLFRITRKDFPIRQTDNVTIHHIDHNHFNNKISNLSLAHRYCHRRYHMLCQKRRRNWIRRWVKKNKRWVMGKAACVILIRYRKGAKIRNCMIKFLAEYKRWKNGDVTVMPVRKLWRNRRKP